MGYRGKVAEQEQARRLRAEGHTMLEIANQLGASKSSVSLLTRDVDFAARRGRYGARRRGPNALQRRKAEEIERLLAEGRERIGQLSEKEFLVAGTALYASALLLSGRNSPTGRALSASGSRRWSRCELLVGRHRHPGLAVGKPYRAVPDVGIRHNKHEHGCISVGYGCSRTHRAIMGLCRGLISSNAIPG